MEKKAVSFMLSVTTLLQNEYGNIRQYVTVTH